MTSSSLEVKSISRNQHSVLPETTAKYKSLVLTITKSPFPILQENPAHSTGMTENTEFYPIQTNQSSQPPEFTQKIESSPIQKEVTAQTPGPPKEVHILAHWAHPGLPQEPSRKSKPFCTHSPGANSSAPI